MNSQEPFTAPLLQYDSQGYVKSFDIETASREQLIEYYHNYGFIVFRNIVSQQEISRTIDDLWNSTIQYNKQTRNKDIDRNNSKTWNQLKGFQKAYGFVGDSILQEPQIWKNRKNPKVYKCFKRGYQAYLKSQFSEPLICNFDRGSLMLPSKLNEDWRSHDIYHFDIDPWCWTGFVKNRHTKYDYNPDRMMMLLGEGNYEPYVGYTKLAGVLALSNTNQTSGGFSCAPGFQNYIKQWCLKNKSYTHIEQDQNLVKNFRKIFMRSGSLLIFSRQLPHNIYQNDSQNFRYAQYLRMSPLSSLCLTQELIQARRKLVKMILPKDLDCSDDISKQIFMLTYQSSSKLVMKTNTQQEKTSELKGKKKSNIKQRRQVGNSSKCTFY